VLLHQFGEACRAEERHPRQVEHHRRGRRGQRQGGGQLEVQRADGGVVDLARHAHDDDRVAVHLALHVQRPLVDQRLELPHDGNLPGEVRAT
jgi:hypothetical protein